MPAAMSSCSTSATLRPRRRGIEERPRADDPATDDEQVPALVREAGEVRGAALERARSSGVVMLVVTAPGAGARIRHRTSPVPPMSTTISSGVWKTTSWPSRGQQRGGAGREHHDQHDGGADEQDLAQAGLPGVGHR